MNKNILEKLSLITDEEKEILAGNGTVNRNLYYNPDAQRQDEIDSSLVLQNGKLIDIRRHVRFVHFPMHTHNFVEFVYMCQGTTTHFIDDQKIVLGEGDLLFLNQHARQEILPAGRNDIAINFMILPQFFDTAFKMMDKTPTPLHSFLISCLTDKEMGGNYLYFNVAALTQVQNLLENLIIAMDDDSPENRLLSQTTMGLLFMTLAANTDKVKVPERSYDEKTMISLLSYIKNNYKSASLTDFSDGTGIEISYLSRLIKRHTGLTFKELLQNERMSRACFLLRNTDLSAAEIAIETGYENTSFFHRLFRRKYNMTPREYRFHS